MVFMESPSNPLLKVFDIEEISYLVKHFNKDIIVVVDNTFMSPYFQRPLNLGADVVVHSLTKYINGHSDVVMGAVITNDEIINKHLLFMQLSRFLKDQSTFGELMPCDRAQHFEHFLLLWHYLKI
jgi:cystathionine gamma-lyase